MRVQRLRQIVAGLRFYQQWLETSRDDLLVDSLLAFIEEKHREEAERAAEQAATAGQGPPTPNIETRKEH
jgi:hypothetical protein